MFWTNASLKGYAREKLRGRWPVYLAVTFVYTLITEGAGWLIGLLFPQYSAQIDELLNHTLNNPMPNPELAMDLLFDLYGSAAGILALSLVVSALVLAVLQVGMYRWFMEARDGAPRFSTLFSGFFSGAQWRNVAWVQFYTSLVTGLWGLLFVIPGVVYAYKVFLVPYLLAENPYMPRKRAVELSKALTNGEKMRVFWLEVSFIGWFLLISLAESLVATVLPALSILVVFVGNVFLTVYMQATLSEFYAAMREKAFQMGLSDATELAGFAA